MRLLLFSTLCLTASVAAAADMGRLQVKANPGRAGVFLDGKYLGPAANFGRARTYGVPAGEHELKLVEPRYEEVTTKITVKAGAKTVHTETMKALPVPQPPFGTLRTIHPDRFAAVYINGKFMGHVDEFSNFAQGMLLNPGTYALKIVPTADGAAAIEKQITIEANKKLIVQ